MTRRLQLRLYRSPVGLYLTVHGSLDARNAHEFGDAVGVAIDRCDAGRLTVDLADVDAVDLAGIAMLALCREAAARRDITLNLAGARVRVREAIRSARADALLAPAAASADPAVPPADQPKPGCLRCTSLRPGRPRHTASQRRAAPRTPRPLP